MVLDKEIEMLSQSQYDSIETLSSLHCFGITSGGDLVF
jgi:hypothetical protein